MTVADPFAELDLADDALRRVLAAAGPYLDSLADRKVFDPEAAKLLSELGPVASVMTRLTAPKPQPSSM